MPVSSGEIFVTFKVHVQNRSAKQKKCMFFLFACFFSCCFAWNKINYVVNVRNVQSMLHSVQCSTPALESFKKALHCSLQYNTVQVIAAQMYACVRQLLVDFFYGTCRMTFAYKMTTNLACMSVFMLCRLDKARYLNEMGWMCIQRQLLVLLRCVVWKW